LHFAIIEKFISNQGLPEPDLYPSLSRADQRLRELHHGNPFFTAPQCHDINNAEQNRRGAQIPATRRTVRRAPDKRLTRYGRCEGARFIPHPARPEANFTTSFTMPTSRRKGREAPTLSLEKRTPATLRNRRWRSKTKSHTK
jgi:hypothetical protein